jgi:hypothetical protein
MKIQEMENKRIKIKERLERKELGKQKDLEMLDKSRLTISLVRSKGKSCILHSLQI